MLLAEKNGVHNLGVHCWNSDVLTSLNSIWDKLGDFCHLHFWTLISDDHVLSVQLFEPSLNSLPYFLSLIHLILFIGFDI